MPTCLNAWVTAMWLDDRIFVLMRIWTEQVYCHGSALALQTVSSMFNVFMFNHVPLTLPICFPQSRPVILCLSSSCLSTCVHLILVCFPSYMLCFLASCHLLDLLCVIECVYMDVTGMHLYQSQSSIYCMHNVHYLGPTDHRLLFID